MGRPKLWVVESEEELVHSKGKFRLSKRDGRWCLLGDSQGLISSWSPRTKNAPRAEANKLLKAMPPETTGLPESSL